MLKRIWNDPVWSKVIAAAILGLCSIIGGFWLHSSQQAKDSKASINEPVHTSIAANATIHPGEPQIVAEHKAFIDSQTGFSFTIDEIDGGHLLWGLLPRADGVLGRYTLPNGEAGKYYRHPVGYRAPFEFGGKKFIFVIVDIDYKSQTATFRVDKLVSSGSQIPPAGKQ